MRIELSIEDILENIRLEPQDEIKDFVLALDESQQEVDFTLDLVESLLKSVAGDMDEGDWNDFIDEMKKLKESK